MNFFAWVAEDEKSRVRSVSRVSAELTPNQDVKLSAPYTLTLAPTPNKPEGEAANVVSLFGNDPGSHLSHISHPIRAVFQQTQINAALRRVADIYRPGDLASMTDNEINEVIEINDQLERALLDESRDLVEALATWECRWRSLILKKRQGESV